MIDWTNIVGDKLKSIEEPLSADDWNLIQQKYAQSRAKKRAVMFAWIGGISTVAASLLLFLVLIKSDGSLPVGDPIIAEAVAPVDSIVKQDLSTFDTPDNLAEEKRDNSDKSLKISVVSKIDGGDKIAEVLTKTERTQDSVIDEITENDRVEESIKESTNIEGDTSIFTNPQRQSAYLGDDFYYENISKERFRKARAPISFGISSNGTFSSYEGLKSVFNKEVEPPALQQAYPGYSYSSMNSVPDKSNPQLSMGSSFLPFSEVYKHQMPLSFGLSVQLYLTDRLSLNTGINYTIYKSTSYRSYVDGTNGSYKQFVHYLGVPLRANYNIINGKLFTLYVGAGAQVDKCIYAKLGKVVLKEDTFIFSLNGVAGLQLEINDFLSLYLEPEISMNLNDGTLNTYRSQNDIILSARAGLFFKI